MTQFRSTSDLFRPEPEPDRSSTDALLNFRSEADPPELARESRLRQWIHGLDPRRVVVVLLAALAVLVVSIAGLYLYSGNVSEAAGVVAEGPAAPQPDDTPAPSPEVLAVPPAQPAAGSTVTNAPSAASPRVGQPAATAGPDVAAKATAGAAALGRLDITSDPAGARVQVDGKDRGVTPLVLSAMAAGAHEIAIVSGRTTVRRRVTVNAGTTATVVASFVPRPAATAPARPAAVGGGWVSFNLPFEAEVFENGRLLGTTRERVALSPGWHELELRNPSLGVVRGVAVQIVAGQTARPSVQSPTGLVSINATPWAEVSIAGRGYGTTPLANISLPVGTYEVVLRHPELGEQRRSIQVAAGAPARLGVSFPR